MKKIFNNKQIQKIHKVAYTHRLLLASFVFFFLFSFVVRVFASPLYNPGDTLDPACAPVVDPDCTVQIIPDQTGNTGKFLTTDGSTVSWGAVTSNIFSTGLTNTSGTVTSDLSTGITGGQNIYGGVDAGDTLTLNSTTNATKGKIIFGISAYDEVNNRLGIGTTTPQVALDVTSFDDGVYGRFQAREGTYQAAFTFNNGPQEVWFFGKQTDDSFIVYDSVAHKYKFRVVSDGSILLGEDGTTNVSVGSTSDTSMFNVGSNGEFQVDSTGAIAAATGITTSGNVTFSDITEGSILFAGTGGVVSQDNTNFFWNDTTNKLGIGTASPSAFVHVLGTTEQIRLGYDASNYLSATVGSTGSATFALTGTSPTFSFSNNVGISCAAADHLLEIGGTGAGCNTGAGSYLNAAGDTTFTANSSRIWKDNITTVEKENILDLIASTPVRRYDWKPEYCDGPQCLNKIGFIAEEFYPVLEHGDDKHVNGQDVSMAEWLGLQKLIQVTKDMDLKIQGLSSVDTESTGTFGYMMKTLLADSMNNISDLYAKVIHSDRVETKELCVGTTCVTEAEFLQMINQSGVSTTPQPPIPDPTPDPTPDPEITPPPDPAPDLVPPPDPTPVTNLTPEPDTISTP